MKEIRSYVLDNHSQSHLCICADELFGDTVKNGVYGFPHAGNSRLKSFWRSAASMYNIGPHDLIFLYRRKGDDPGCQEIHGPFKVYAPEGLPAIYYDRDSTDLELKVRGEMDCKVRFMFKNEDSEIYSINDNYEVVKKFENKQIWGYRHPAVMNIGAARKKSITAFSHKATITFLDLMQNFGSWRMSLEKDIPSPGRLSYYNSLPNNVDEFHFRLNDSFLLDAQTNDEAFLYAYINRGLKSQNSCLHDNLMRDFSAINDVMLNDASNSSFRDFSNNIMMEVIVSPHLQDELDIVLFTRDESKMLIMELKNGSVDTEAVQQTVRYMDLLRAVFPGKTIFANVIGNNVDAGVSVEDEFEDFVRVACYKRDYEGKVRFEAGP